MFEFNLYLFEFKTKGMDIILRGIMILFVTFLITFFVTDFQAVLDGFTAFLDFVSSLIRPGR
jgi:hypothetical protein